MVRGKGGSDMPGRRPLTLTLTLTLTKGARCLAAALMRVVLCGAAARGHRRDRPTTHDRVRPAIVPSWLEGLGLGLG